MFRAVTEYLIALLELLQAEGRAVRKRLYDLGVSLILAWVAGVLTLAAMALLIWALYLALVPVVPQSVAALVCGLLLLLVSGGLLWSAGRRNA